jgi:hypothetical protein
MSELATDRKMLLDAARFKPSGNERPLPTTIGRMTNLSSSKSPVEER